MEFYILNVNGGAVPNYEQGKKDVVFVMPQQYVEFVTKFEDFADDSIPYMYHCHLLHHEDDGMMGSFRVIDTTGTGIADISESSGIKIFPNPATNEFKIKSLKLKGGVLKIYNVLGEMVYELLISKEETTIDVSFLNEGIYFVQVKTGNGIYNRKIIKE